MANDRYIHRHTTTVDPRPRQTDLGRHGEAHGKMRYGYESTEAFDAWLWHLDNGRILTGKR